MQQPGVVSIVVCALMMISSLPAAAQWMPTNGPGGGIVSAVASNGTDLFAATGNGGFGFGAGIFRSTNNGVTWTPVATPVGTSRDDKNISSLSASGGNIAAGRSGGVIFLSSDNGATWIRTTLGTTTKDVLCLATDGTRFFAGTNGGGIYAREFSGTAWVALNAGLTNKTVTSMFVSGAIVYASTAYGGTPLFRSTNSGASWTNIPLPAAAFNAFSVAMLGGKLYIGTQNGLYTSTDTGAVWTGPLSGLTNAPYAFALAGTKVLVGSTQGLYSVPAAGGSLTLLSNKYDVRSLLSAVSGIYMGAGNSFVTGGSGGGVFASTDNGTSWNARTTNLAASTVHGMALNGSQVLAITPNNGLFSSTDKGDTWSLLTPNARSFDATLQTILVRDGTIFAAAATGYLSSSDNGTTWTASSPGFMPQAFFSYGSKILAGEGGGIRISTNGGSTWVQSNTGLTGYLSTNCFASKGGTLFAGLYSEGVFVSADSGATWTPANTGLTNRSVRTIVTLGSNVYAGTADGGVFVSSNNGGSWSAANSGLSSSNVWSLIVTGSTLFAGSNDGVHQSSDSGKTWKKTSPWPVITNTLLATATDLYAGTIANGVWKRALSELITDVETGRVSIPERSSLSQNYPNPFNPSTTIRYTVSAVGPVRLRVFDMLGREMASLVDAPQAPGTYDIRFDGSTLSSGMYFYQLRTGGFVDVKRMVFTK